MFPLLQIGPLTIHTPGLIYLLALWIGLGQMERAARLRGLNTERLYSLSMTALLAGLAGARLAYVAQSPAAFLANPLALLSPTPTMLDLTGGLVVALLAGLIYGQRRGLPFWPTLDAFTPTLAILMIGGGLANLAAGSAYGAPTHLPWGIELWGATRHPSQIYAILTALAIAAVTWPRPSRIDWPEGMTFLIFLALSAGARLFLETFRGDVTLLIGPLRGTQVAAWLILAAALWMISKQPFSKDNHGSNLH